MLPGPRQARERRRTRDRKIPRHGTSGAKARRQTLNEMNIRFRNGTDPLEAIAVRPPPKHSHDPAETRQGGADAGEAEKDVQDMLVTAGVARFLRDVRARFRRSLVFDSDRCLDPAKDTLTMTNLRSRAASSRHLSAAAEEFIVVGSPVHCQQLDCSRPHLPSPAPAVGGGQLDSTACQPRSGQRRADREWRPDCR